MKTPKTNEKKSLSIAEYIRITGMSRPTIRYMCETGQIKAFKTPKGHWKIDAQAETPRVSPEIRALAEQNARIERQNKRLEKQNECIGQQNERIENMLAAICRQFNVSLPGGIAGSRAVPKLARLGM